MTEHDYWVHLEYRVSRELVVIENNVFSALWCDGFIPESYILDARDPHITDTYGSARVGDRIAGSSGSISAIWFVRKRVFLGLNYFRATK